MNTKYMAGGILRLGVAISLAFGFIVLADNAVSAQYGNYGRYGGYGNGIYQIAQQNGYNDGLRKGQEDARERHNNPTGTELYKDGDNGYDRRMGSKDQYRAIYRQAFLRGFSDGQNSYYGGGYGQYGNYGRYPNGGYPNSGYPNGGYYPDGGYGNQYPTYGGNGNDIYRIAQQNGYNDGLRKGAEDAREGHNNPAGTSLYKNADNGYDRSMGNKEAYRQAYRQAFLQGFAEGQRNSGYYRNGRGYGGSILRQIIIGH